MTIQELEQVIEGRKVIRHNGQCFINVRDEQDARRYIDLGAEARPFPSYCPGWEIHLGGMLDPMPELNAAGEEVDVRGAFLLQHFRERDGFSGHPSA